jgi:hypothetical protein
MDLAGVLVRVEHHADWVDVHEAVPGGCPARRKGVGPHVPWDFSG